MCKRHIPLEKQQKSLRNRRLGLCANEWYAPGTCTEGWHVALDSLLIGDQSMLIDQQLASTDIPQRLGYMVFGEHCLKIQCCVCSREETLAFVPLNQMPRAPFSVGDFWDSRIMRTTTRVSILKQTNHCMPSKAGNG